MGFLKALLVVVMFFPAGLALQSHDYLLKMITDVLLYEESHSSPTVTTVLLLCQGDKQSLLRSLSGVGMAALITDDKRTANEMNRIARMDPALLMVSGVQIPNERGFPVSFLLDMECAQANETLQMGENVSKCDLSTIADLPIRTDSHVTMACRSGHENKRWSFQHWYRIGESETPLMSQERGEWNEGQLSIDRHSDMLIQRDLMGYPVGASYVIVFNRSLAHLTDGKERHIDALTKSSVLNVYTVLESMNATPFALFTDTWGYKRENNTWQDGMIGMLHQAKADVGGTGSIALPNRYDAVQYLIYTIPMPAVFLFRAPPISYEYNLFGLPFSKSVWAISAAVLSLCCILLFAVLHYERRNNYQKNEKPGKLVEKPTENSEQATLVDVLLVGFAAICQQGATTQPHGITSRIITIWLYLCVICLYASYTASIVVLLQTSGTSIRNLRDFWKSDIEAGAEGIPFNFHYFQHSKDEVRRGIYHDKMLGKSPSNNFFTLEEGVQRVRTRFFAFHTGTNNLYHMIGLTWREDEKCNLIEFDNYLPSNQIALSLRKDSPFVEMLRVKFALIYESGHRDWLHRRWIYRKPQCPPNMVRFSSVSIIDVIAAIQVFGLGILLSVLIFAVEVLIHFLKEQEYYKSRFVN